MFEPEESSVSQKFLVPLREAFSKVSSKRKCHSYTDENHLISGVNRALSDHRSGRAWVQYFQFISTISLTVDGFFKALRSERRAAIIESANQALVDEYAVALPEDDPFTSTPELDKFAIYATDGHSLAHSVHDETIKDKKRANNHIFALNLRSRLMEHIALCVPEEDKAKKHEISTLKKLDKKTLRMRQPKGVKVVHVYDPAIVDYRYWLELKRTGIYIVTVEKEKSAFWRTAILEFDRNDPRNLGVISDEYVVTSNEVMIRRIVYEDPVTGRIYKFITTITDKTVPPGAIAFMYKSRWDIEKAFDQTKNRFMERKSWGKSETSKQQQAHFICLAYNLCALLEKKLKLEEGIVDEKVRIKQQKRKETEKRQAESAGRKMNSLVMGSCLITQRSSQFIRWLRVALDHATPWKRAVSELRPLMIRYLP